MITTISNPPYNMRWSHPMFVQVQDRFCKTQVPPENNANLAFVLTAINESDRCVFILPNGVLTSENKIEKSIMKYLIDCNFIEAIISCPDKMFEATSIPTCIFVLDKNKTTSTVEMLDMRNKYEIETREQNGQFGSKSHTNRTYKKDVKVFTDKIIDEALECIEDRKDIHGYCKCVSLENIKEREYILKPSTYINYIENEILHRSYNDIICDLNRVIRDKNNCKLTINETIAKSLGFDIDLYKKDHIDNKELNYLIKKLSNQIICKHNYFQLTKNKNEVKFENNDKENISSIFMMIFNMWKQHIYYLNIEENRYLVELRDALLPELMNGKINVNGEEIDNENT